MKLSDARASGFERLTATGRVGLTVATAVFGLAVGDAHAARYKKGEVAVQATQTVKTKAPTAKKEAAPRRPQLDVEQFRAAAKARAAALTDAAISKLHQLIKITEDTDPEKPDYYFRLAEHYKDKRLVHMFKARELDETIYQTQDGAKKQRLQHLQKQYENAERQWLLKAVKMYLDIYRGAIDSEGGKAKQAFVKYKRMDEVLYNLAAMLQEVKKADRAREVFGHLIRNHPQSPYIADAYLSFAEFYFNEGQVEKALRLYKAVGKYQDSPIYGYSVYKQAWCWLNLKEPRKALELFVTVIQNATQWKGTKKGRILLVREAKKDAVRAYAHVGEPDQAWKFFKRVGGDYAMTMLERLAAIYYDQGKFLDSIRIYKQLIKINPRSPQLCNWQYAIVRSTLSGKDKREQVVEIQRLAAVYTLSAKQGGMRKAALTECRGNAAAVLRELATTWHREAQKTHNNDTYAMAQYLYKEYLEHFPKEKDAYVMAFYYAELLFKLERWQLAADAYTHVVKMNQKGKYLQEAAYAAVISWKNALNVDDEVRDTSKVKPGEKNKPRPIPEKQQRMIAAFDTYLKYVPTSPERSKIMYRKARIYYENNHFAKSATMFGDVVQRYPNDQLAVFSANLLLDALGIIGKFEEMNQWIEKFKKLPKLMGNPEFKETVEKIARSIMFKRAEQLRKDAKYRECGDAYAQMANEGQNDPRWAKFAFNAAICYEAAKLIGQAIAIRQSLIRVKPKDPLAQKALFMIGGNYHALAWYSEAARYYEAYAQKFPGEKEAPEALQNAIVFRLGLGEHGKAAENARYFAKKYGGRPQYAMRTASVIFSLGGIHEGKKDTDGLLKHYQGYLKSWGGKGGADRTILAHVRMGEALWRSSCPNPGVNGACVVVKRELAKRSVKKKKGKKGKKKGIELRAQCGPETKSKITVLKRNDKKAKSAQVHFSTALKLAGKAARVKGVDKKEADQRKQELAYALAAARFYLAESQFEDFLKVPFPKNLDFSGKNKKALEKSKKEFGKYLDSKGKMLTRISTLYQRVITEKQAHWAIAGAARIGQLYQNFADALFTAPVPKPPIPKPLMNNKDLREEFISTFTDAYCDALEDKANPLEKKAIEGLAVCLNKSTELSWFNEWSSLCEAELNQIQPNNYPLAAEIRAQPGYFSLKPDRAAVVESVK